MTTVVGSGCGGRITTMAAEEEDNVVNDDSDGETTRMITTSK
jgi:hypothetical protein